MRKSKPIEFAAQMAHGWSDEVLLQKKPEDLVAAYGCTLDNANYILKNELTRRKISR
jgi:hypothetical protein